MRLTPMRYKDYVWPNNPESYRIVFKRPVAVHKIPYGRYAMQDMGMSCRVLEGEGAFVGAGAYEEFKKLATVFYDGGAGVLVHPVWMTTKAYFVELEVEQEPLPDYVRYRFAFWEALDEQTALRKVSAAAGTSGSGETRWCTVSRGDTLWSIAARCGTTVSALLEENPQIKNPNLLSVGERVRLP